METIVEVNHSLLIKLPLGLQNVLKSLPLSDISIVLFVLVSAFGVLFLLCGCESGSKGEFERIGEYKRENKVVTVKVNTPNQKKASRRSKKKRESPTVEAFVEEKKVEYAEDKTEEGWEIVKPKKPKRKDE